VQAVQLVPPPFVENPAGHDVQTVALADE